ncbi:MAG: hypothetical protein M1816_003398 [Peltula sp. TS41687]|nr:MAG: hypothetical protein M1816_003398 [Peltula sp. TS41687]
MTSSSSSSPSTSNPPQLTAIYRSSKDTKEFQRSIEGAATASSEPTTKEKTAYLSGLRSSVTAMQDEINVYLTQKMEEDKASGEKSGVGGTSQSGRNAVTDEIKEEDLYGEELVEDDGA